MSFVRKLYEIDDPLEISKLISSSIKSIFNQSPEICFFLEEMLIDQEALVASLEHLKFRKVVEEMNDSSYELSIQGYYVKKAKTDVCLASQLFYLEREMNNATDNFPFFTSNGLRVGSISFFEQYLERQENCSVKSFTHYYQLVKLNFAKLTKLTKHQSVSKKMKKKLRNEFILSDLIYDSKEVQMDSELAELLSIFRIHLEEAAKYKKKIEKENKIIEEKRSNNSLTAEDFRKRYIYKESDIIRENSLSSLKTTSTELAVLANSPKDFEKKREFYKQVNGFSFKDRYSNYFSI